MKELKNLPIITGSSRYLHTWSRKNQNNEFRLLLFDLAVFKMQLITRISYKLSEIIEKFPKLLNNYHKLENSMENATTYLFTRIP